MTAQIVTVLGPAPDAPGARQQPSTVDVSEGATAGIAAHVPKGPLRVDFGRAVNDQRTAAFGALAALPCIPARSVD
jgi:hypothetical protein